MEINKYNDQKKKQRNWKCDTQKTNQCYLDLLIIKISKIQKYNIIIILQKKKKKKKKEYHNLD